MIIQFILIDFRHILGTKAFVAYAHTLMSAFTYDGLFVAGIGFF